MTLMAVRTYEIARKLLRGRQVRIFRLPGEGSQGFDMIVWVDKILKPDLTSERHGGLFRIRSSDLVICVWPQTQIEILTNPGNLQPIQTKARRKRS